MRTAELLEEEELAGNDADLHLGMGSLIGIFFGLALVCGVFFGFGYMMGHRTPGTYVSSEPLYVAPKPQAIVPKPSAQIAEQPTEAQRVVVQDTAASTTTNEPQVSKQPKPSPPPSLAAVPESPSRSAATAKAEAPSPTATLGPSPAAVQPTGSIMVQIAAVKSRPDAEALAAALQKNGFTPSIRTEAQDKLLHVQVGPFSSRDEAKAMRQKLSNAGYNAFIK